MTKNTNKYFRIKVALTFLLILSISLSFGQALKMKVSGDKFAKRGDIITISGNCKTESDGVKTSFDRCEQSKGGTKIVATGNVHTMAKGIEILSDKLLISDGIYKYRDNVRLITEEGKTLTTSHLDYMQKTSSGHFFNGGQVVDSTSTLDSKEGYFYPKRNEYVFVDSVVAKNEDHTLYTDTLTYNLLNKTVTIHGPTDIVGDSTTAYCERGWYKMAENTGYMGQNATIVNGHHLISGDSLFYDKSKGISEGFSRVELSDTTQHIIISGRYAKYFLNQDRGFVTDSALLFQFTKTDSLYLHADTLTTEYDTSGTYQIIRAFNRAQMFRRDLQSRSDSMVYTLNDSVIHIFKEPVIWATPNQITAESMHLLTKDNRPYLLEMKKSAFVISKETEHFFNQIKGKNMIGHFKGGRLRQLDVNQSSETIYFPIDNGVYIGVNKLKGEKMEIMLFKNRIREIIMRGQSDGNLDPLGLTTEEYKLSNFVWLEEYRPKKIEDIFIWREIETKTKKEKGGTDTLIKN